MPGEDGPLTLGVLMTSEISDEYHRTNLEEWEYFKYDIVLISCGKNKMTFESKALLLDFWFPAYLGREMKMLCLARTDHFTFI